MLFNPSPFTWFVAANTATNHLKGEMLINKSLWYAMDDQLGEITDFRIESDADFVYVRYKSNGVDKQIMSNDKSFKFLLLPFAYAAKVVSNPFDATFSLPL